MKMSNSSNTVPIVFLFVTCSALSYNLQGNNLYETSNTMNITTNAKYEALQGKKPWDKEEFLNNDFNDKLVNAKDISDFQVICSFAEKLLKDSVGIEPEIREIIDEFWFDML